MSINGITKEQVRLKIVEIVAAYHGVETSTITDDTQLGFTGLNIVTQITIDLNVGLYGFDYRTETVGQLIGKCEKKFA